MSPSISWLTTLGLMCRSGYGDMSCSDKNHIIGTSLSEPHTSMTAFVEVVCMYVCMYVYMYACGHIP